MSFVKTQWQRLSSRQRHVSTGIGVALMLYALLGFIVVPLAGRPLAEDFLNQQLHYPCQIGSVRLNPFTLRLEVNDLYVGEADDAVVSWQQLELDLSWSTIWSGALQIERLRLVKPQVIGGLDREGQPILVGLVEALQEEAAAADASGGAPQETEVEVAMDPELSVETEAGTEKNKATAANDVEADNGTAQAAETGEVVELIDAVEGIAVVEEASEGVVRGETDIEVVAGELDSVIEEEAELVAQESTSMLAIDLARFELVEGRAIFVDQRPVSPFRAEAEAISLALDNISTRPDREGQLELQIKFAQGAELHWRGSLQVEPVQAQGHIALLNISLPELNNYLEGRLQGVLSQGLLGVETDYQLQYQDGVDLELSNIGVVLEAFELLRSAQGKQLISIPHLSVSEGAFSLAKRTLSLGQIEGRDAVVELAFDHQGQVDLASLWVAPPEASAPSEPQPAVVEPPWQWQLPALKLSNWTVNATDLSAPPARWPLSQINLELSGLSPQATAVPFSFAAQLGAGQLSTTGQVDLTSNALKLNIKTQQLDLTALNPYLDPLVSAQLKSGSLGSALDFSWQPTAGMSLSGDIWSEQVASGARAGSRLAGWRRLEINQLVFNQQASQLQVADISIEGADAALKINADGSLNYSGLLKQQKATSPSTPESAGSAPSGEPAMVVDIGQVTISDSQLDFSDKSMGQAFAIQVGQLQGALKGISTQPGRIATVALDGRVDRQAPIKISGQLSPMDPEHKTDLKVALRHLPLTSFSAYSGQFAGYKIKKGRMNLDLNYRVAGGKLRGENKVLIEQLTLGARVDSPDAVDLPIALGIALLKGPDGSIYMDLPISGDLNHPDFSYGSVVWGAVSNLLVKVVSSPFSALGSIFGEGDQQNVVVFAPAEEALSSESKQLLQSLSEALAERQTLMLELTGVASDDDWQRVARQQLRASAMQRYNEDAWFEIKSLGEMEDEQYREGLEKLYPDQQDEALTLAAFEEVLVILLPPDKLALRALARGRAAAVRDYLVEQGGLAPERVFMLDPQLLVEKSQPSVLLTLDAQ